MATNSISCMALIKYFFLVLFITAVYQCIVSFPAAVQMSVTTPLHAPVRDSGTPSREPTSRRVVSTSSNNNNTVETVETLDSDRASQDLANVSNVTASDRRVYLSVSMGPGRLGNDLFRYAALRGIADRSNMTPIILKPTHKVQELAATFVLKKGIIGDPADFEDVTWIDFRENLAAAYDPRSEKLGDQDTHIRKYFQSYKYFNHLEQDIREELTFNESLKSETEQFLREAATMLSLPAEAEVTYIGMHARRTSMCKNKTNNAGYVSPPVDYYIRAAELLSTKYPNPIFVICSDDTNWCLEHLVPKFQNAVVSQKHSAQMDMAILSRCNHTIISSGTYGWWSAWLAGGETVYYKDFPWPNSSLDQITNRKDYYPSHWIPM